MKKTILLVAILVMVLTASAPLLAQVGDTGDAPALRPDPNDPYRIFISNDQAVYCGYGVVGDPITEFCIENGITPPVLYDANGNLIAGSGTNAGIQYDNSDTTRCLDPLADHRGCTTWIGSDGSLNQAQPAS